MRLIKYFLVGLLAGFALFFPIFLFLYSFYKAVIASLIVGFIYSLFVIGFMMRKLVIIEFEINSQNKDPEKGLSWYEDKIKEQIKDMRFRQYLKVDGLTKYRATGLYQVLEGKIEVRVSAYDIHVKCSKMMRRILLDLVEIKIND